MSLRLMRRLSRPQNAQAATASFMSRRSLGRSANWNEKKDEKPETGGGLAEKLKKQKSSAEEKRDSSDKLGNLLQQMKRQTKEIEKEKKETMDKIKLSQPPPKAQKKSAHRPSMSKLGLDPQMADAVSEAAEHIGKTVKGAQPEVVKNDLTARLRMMIKETTSSTEQPDDKPKDKPVFDKSILSDLKVVKEPKEKKELTQEQRDFLEMRRRKRSGKTTGEKITNVDSIEPWDEILKFADTAAPAQDAETQIRYFKMLEERHLRIIKQPSARNFVEEMINWTEKGILWKFPIDNEQDLTLVEPFHQHVFLERHLEGWCPKRGPLRHFMELVCIGLQNNPYISVQKKLDHIRWFQDYFGEKTKAEIIQITHGEN